MTGPEKRLPWPHDRRLYASRLRAVLPSNKQALNGAVRRVLRIAASCGCAGDGQADIEIALREALANAMIHGNAYHDSKSIFLRCYGAPGHGMLIMVRDEGPGFEPESVPDPRGPDRMFLHHGRGLFLMRQLMDYTAHRKNGREVVLYKSVSCDEREDDDSEDSEDSEDEASRT